MWIDLSKWVNSVKTLVSQVNVPQKVTSADEYFNNQVDKFICFVDPSWSLFPVTLVIIQRDQEKSNHGGKDGSFAWGQQHGFHQY